MTFKRLRSLIPGVALLALAVAPALTGCTDETEPVTSADPDRLSLNGNCEVYEIQNPGKEAWDILSAPDWVTPVRGSGRAGEPIKIYVESNSTAFREGEVSIRYKSGRSRAVEVKQDTTKTAEKPSLQRTYAIGWSFDIRTYMDFRGLREQIINTQKLIAFDSTMIVMNEPSSTSQTEFYYGESSSELSDNMGASLDAESKYNSFNLDLQASFGKSALNSSKRIFSRIRCNFLEKQVSLNNFDEMDAQIHNLFTLDFAAEREKVIASNASDESVRHLLDRYGTHLVTMAYLGGFYDYFFSSVVENASDLLNVEAALNFGFSEKFNLNASGNYKNDFAKLNQERIEKFAVKGGNALDLSMAVENGSISEKITDAWRKSLQNEYKYELLGFELLPIYSLFPDTISDRIKAYIDRMYYREIPVNRSAE